MKLKNIESRESLTVQEALEGVKVRCKIAGYHRRNHFYEKANSYYRQCLQQLQVLQQQFNTGHATAGDSEQRAYQVNYIDVHFGIISTYYEQGKPDECAPYMLELKNRIDDWEPRESFYRCKYHLQLFDLDLHEMRARRKLSLKYSDLSRKLEEIKKHYFDPLKRCEECPKVDEFEAYYLYRIARAGLLEYSDDYENLVAAAQDYRIALKALRKISRKQRLENNLSIMQRQAMCQFNLSKVTLRLVKNGGRFKDAIRYLERAERTLTSSSSYTDSSFEVCRVRLQIAAVHEHENNLKGAIKLYKSVCDINREAVRSNPGLFNSLDLQLYVQLIKHIARLYVRGDGFVEASGVMVDYSSVMIEAPFLRINCLRLALKYLSLSRASSGVVESARLCAEVSLLLKSLAVPNIHLALNYMHGAARLDPDNDEYQKGLVELKKLYHDSYSGWSASILMQWQWCLNEYVYFNCEWYNGAKAHARDFMHARVRNITLPPSSRIQLVMMLSRIYCLLDQAHYQTIKTMLKYTASELLFPVVHSEDELRSVWRNQGCWNARLQDDKRSMSYSYRSGYGYDLFDDLKKIITECQPYAGKTDWLNKLSNIYHHSKHVHIGSQLITHSPPSVRKGTLVSQNSCMSMTMPRNRVILYPKMFSDILGSTEDTKKLYPALKHCHILRERHRTDPAVTTIAYPYERGIQSFISALRDNPERKEEERGRFVAQIAEIMTANDIDSSKASDVAAFILNSTAEAEGLFESKETFPVLDFLSSVFHGVFKILAQFACLCPSPTISYKFIASDLSGSDMSQASIMDRTLSDNISKISSLKKSALTTRDIRPINAAFGMLVSYHACRSDPKRLIELFKTVEPILPKSLLLFHRDKISQPVGSAQVVSSLSYLDIKVFPPSQFDDSSLISRDLICRMQYVHDAVYVQLPALFLVESEEAYHKRVNIIANVYLHIHFSLDQLMQRVISQAEGSVTLNYNHRYPCDEHKVAIMMQKIRCSGSFTEDGLSDFEALVRNSLAWWKDFRAIALEAKHAGIHRIEEHARFLLRHDDDTKSCLLDVYEPGYGKHKHPVAKFMFSLKNALEFTKHILHDGFSLISHLTPRVYKYTHVMASGADPTQLPDSRAVAWGSRHLSAQSVLSLGHASPRQPAQSLDKASISKLFAAGQLPKHIVEFIVSESERIKQIFDELRPGVDMAYYDALVAKCAAVSSVDDLSSLEVQVINRIGSMASEAQPSSSLARSSVAL